MPYEIVYIIWKIEVEIAIVATIFHKNNETNEKIWPESNIYYVWLIIYLTAEKQL